MSDEVYGVWKDEMVSPNAGALGTPAKPVVDVKASVKVPDGLWVVHAKIGVDNEASTHQTVSLVLHANTLTDHAVVRLAPQSSADRTSVSLMLLAHFPGTRTWRANTISLGLWDKGDPPDVKVGRMKIIAQRTTYWIMEPSPGTSAQ
jgi:hypothetical protein